VAGTQRLGLLVSQLRSRHIYPLHLRDFRGAFPSGKDGLSFKAFRRLELKCMELYLHAFMLRNLSKTNRVITNEVTPCCRIYTWLYTLFIRGI